MNTDTFTYTRRATDGHSLIQVVNHRAGTLARHEPAVRALALGGHTDPEIGAQLGLTAKQVEGIRNRAQPPIHSARGAGRPRGARDTRPRKRHGDDR